MRTKRLVIGTVLVVMVLVMVMGTAWAIEAEDGTKLTGQHYNLNILGKAWDDKAPIEDCEGGHRIFVNLGESVKNQKGKGGKSSASSLTQIMLTMAPPGESFAVLDCDGTGEDNTAEFQLPDPNLDPYVVGDKGNADTMSAYSVFVRPLGKPGGWSTITTCAEVNETNLAAFMSAQEATAINEACEIGDGLASIEQVGAEIELADKPTYRKKGKTKFTNVTAELLTIVLKVWVDLDGEGDQDPGEIFYVRVPIFDDILENEYWQYDNHGLKILQVRFYPIGTDVSEGDDDLPPL
jgi:hypothetical protein